MFLLNSKIAMDNSPDSNVITRKKVFLVSTFFHSTICRDLESSITFSLSWLCGQHLLGYDLSVFSMILSSCLHIKKNGFDIFVSMLAL